MTKTFQSTKYNEKFSVSQVRLDLKPGMDIPVQMLSLYTVKTNEQQFVIGKCKNKFLTKKTQRKQRILAIPSNEGKVIFILPYRVRPNEKYFPSYSDYTRKTETKDKQRKHRLGILFQVERALEVPKKGQTDILPRKSCQSSPLRVSDYVHVCTKRDFSALLALWLLLHCNAPFIF